MFVVSKWEDDIPASNINFMKRKRVKNENRSLINGIKKKKVKPSIPLLSSFRRSQEEPNTKKESIPINNAAKSNTKKLSKVNKNKTKSKCKKNKQDITNHGERKLESDLNSYIDTDKPDEAILNCKKKKLDDALKHDDVEDILFTEKPLQETVEKKHNLNDSAVSDTIKKLQSNLLSNKKKKEVLPTKNVIEIKNIGIPSDSDKMCESSTNIESDIKVSLAKGNKVNHSILAKKQKLRNILHATNSQRNIINTSSANLRQKMLERLKAAKFRYINEKLYTSSGAEARQFFQSDPIAFQTYHQGYQQQLKKWPINPLQIIIKRIQKLPKTHMIADMGCGEALLSQRIPHNVRSFDLVSTSPRVEVCDIARTPLLPASIDVVVYCLALMGTELTQYLIEANRVLKKGGLLLIAEVESRFENVDSFIRNVQQLGFSLVKLNKSYEVFFFMEFSKVRESPAKKSSLPMLTLRPCLYKKR